MGVCVRCWAKSVSESWRFLWLKGKTGHVVGGDGRWVWLRAKKPHTAPAVPGLHMTDSWGTVQGSVSLCAVVFSPPLATCLQLLLEIGYWVGQVCVLNQSACSPVQWQRWEFWKCLTAKIGLMRKFCIFLRGGQDWFPQNWADVCKLLGNQFNIQ